jgi:hypothetical protein
MYMYVYVYEHLLNPHKVKDIYFIYTFLRDLQTELCIVIHTYRKYIHKFIFMYMHICIYMHNLHTTI